MPMLNCFASLLTLVGLFFGFSADASERPNILWITSEDNNVNWVGCYGNPHAHTPHIDKLASEGFQYMNCFANAPVCAPSRSGWITGVHPVSLGTLPMRSRYDIPHQEIKYYPDYLKEVGYYCSNARKTDYNIGGHSDDDCWDSIKVNLNILKKKQPFFQVINFSKSHESQAFGSVENTQHDPKEIRLAKYHPDIPTIRKNYAHYHDAVERMDDQVGHFLKQMNRMGLMENTIVIYNSDHGGVLPRSKRHLFNSGTHCPLIIRIPEKYRAWWPADATGSKIDRLVSFIDMPKTWLSLAGAEVPEVMQGKIFLGKDCEAERPYHISYRERMDESFENQRAIRNKRYLYIRNYMPFVPLGQRLEYLWKMEASRAWENWHDAGKTNEVTGRWFLPKPSEELYDTWEDPDNVINLIDNSKYMEIANELRQELSRWQKEKRDLGLLPESERAKRAEDLGITLCELAKNPEAYGLDAYLEASDLALQRDARNFAQLKQFLQDKDSGVRYWGVIGLLLLDQKPSQVVEELSKVLTDESHSVRAMAAYALHLRGQKEQARETLSSLLHQESHATLLVLNIIAWLKEDPAYFHRAIQGTKNQQLQPYVQKMKGNLSFYTKN
jgi:N-sulfoglucosamine sulfohydrolase